MKHTNNQPPSARYLCFVDEAGKMAHRELSETDRSYDLFPHSADFGFVIVYHPALLSQWGLVDTSWTRLSTINQLEVQKYA